MAQAELENLSLLTYDKAFQTGLIQVIPDHKCDRPITPPSPLISPRIHGMMIAAIAAVGMHAIAGQAQGQPLPQMSGWGMGSMHDIHDNPW